MLSHKCKKETEYKGPAEDQHTAAKLHKRYLKRLEKKKSFQKVRTQTHTSGMSRQLCTYGKTKCLEEAENVICGLEKCCRTCSYGLGLFFFFLGVL